MIARPEFPVALDDDDDDVAWALSTAQVQWKRGSQADAVVWLRRAIDSAVSVGATWRAAELTRQTDELEAALVGSTAAPSALAVEDFDGTDMIDEEALSLPPDADMNESLRAPLHADATDERTDVTPVEEQPSGAVEEVEVEEEVVEIDEDDISEDDISEDDLEEGAPRFESEAPTANIPQPDFRLPYEIEPESEVPDTVSERVPETRSEPAPAAPTRTESEVEPEREVEPEVEPEPDVEPEPEPDVEPEPEPEVEPEPHRRPELFSQPDPEFASEPMAQPEPELPPPSVQTEPFVAGISLAEIRGFEDFPPETQLELSRVARVERLATDEEVSGFGLALVLRGAANVMPAIADVACGAAGERELIYGRGTLTEGVALRLVATAPDTQVAIWEFSAIEPPLANCPWVLDELRAVADRYQALAGVAMGPMGDRLDDSLRAMVLSRCKLVRLLPGELLVEKGKPVGGLYIVGAGRLDLGVDAANPGSEGHLGPGDFLFAQTILAGGLAPTAARAGAAGALLMAADRHAAHELMLSVPPLLELLAG